MKNNDEITVAFDVDGTLINEADDSPRYEVIALFRAFESLGCIMVIWSGGGVPYAQRWSEKLGLKALILAKASICADVAFDDYPGGENVLGKTVICVGNQLYKEPRKIDELERILHRRSKDDI